MNEGSHFALRKLLTARELCEVFRVTPGWVYTRTKKDAIDPLPVVRAYSGRCGPVIPLDVGH
jgi:hypothetical protein